MERGALVQLAPIWVPLIVVALTYLGQQFTTYRRGQRELHALLRLIMAETTKNTRLGWLLLRRPELRNPFGITQLAEKLTDEAWKETRVRLAQLLPDENHFDSMNEYYSQVAGLMRIATQAAKLGEDTDDAVSRAEVELMDEHLAELLEEISGRGQDLQDIILRYISPLRVGQYRTDEQVDQETEQLIERIARRQADKEIERMEREEGS